jgi:uncharacterized membrane protein
VTGPRPRRTRAHEPPPRRAWEVLALAIAGAAIASYLTVTKLTATPLLFCGAGSACDVVQQSRYATVLGAPTALWGGVLYIALALLAAWPLTPQRWLWTFVLATGGAAFSCYLTGVSVVALKTTCAWCLASTTLMLVLFAAVLRRRPLTGANRTWVRPRRVTAVAALVAIGVVGLSMAAFHEGAASPYQEALARHLSATGARFYGAYWCPHCREQKALFAGAADLLPYVECDAGGFGGRPDVCAQAGVRVFPTWVIGGERREGVLSTEMLAQLSAFTPPTTTR